MPFPESHHRAGNSRYYSLGCVTLYLALLLSQTGNPAPWGTLPGPPKLLYRRRERRRCLELARWPECFVNPWPVCDQSWKLSLTKCQMSLAGRLVISDQALAGLDLITVNWGIFYLSSLLKSLSQTAIWACFLAAATVASFAFFSLMGSTNNGNSGHSISLWWSLSLFGNSWLWITSHWSELVASDFINCVPSHLAGVHLTKSLKPELVQASQSRTFPFPFCGGVTKYWSKQTKNPQHRYPTNVQLHMYSLQDYLIITQSEACEVSFYDQVQMTNSAGYISCLALIYFEVLSFQHRFNAQLPGIWSNTLHRFF